MRAQYQLYKSFSAAMYNIAIRLVNNKMDAEDILQESFTKAFTRLDDLEDPAAFPGWLKRIVINRCISFQRKQKGFFEALDHELPESAFESEEPESEPDPGIVHQAIRSLPDGSRTILVLHALEGYKHREIAALLDISESTSKTQYSRALSLLGKELKNKLYVE
jgi:RNA polymerase sigma factor (sigma-70 family)